MRPSRFRPASLLSALVGLVAGCATAPQPITKIVNGQVVETRAVSPEAYEHVARAYLYEEEERWQEAADELQRALPFDPDAADVRAELGELFVRLGRLDDAADEIARSLASVPTVAGYLAEAHLAEVRSVDPHQPAANPEKSLEQAARLALADEDAEQIETTHLELADVQMGTLDLSAALETVRRLVHAAPETQRGRVQLAALAWTMDARDEASAALTSALDDEPADVEARVLLAELHIAGGQDKQAKTSFVEAIDRADAPLEIAAAFAGWLVLRGDLVEAQELADRLNADVPDVDALEQAAGARADGQAAGSRAGVRRACAQAGRFAGAGGDHDRGGAGGERRSDAARSRASAPSPRATRSSSRPTCGSPSSCATRERSTRPARRSTPQAAPPPTARTGSSSRSRAARSRRSEGTPRARRASSTTRWRRRPATACARTG